MFYGLIGEKLSHSFSKTIHKLLGNPNYELYSLPRERLADFLTKEDFGGLNVTIPYKKDVIPFCDELSEAAKKIGSVNTLVKRNGRLCGDNTDYDGFLYAARRASIDFRNKKVLLLGTGGTSLTARAAAEDSGASEIITVSRRGEVNYSNLDAHSDCEIIINTTPYGMYPDNKAEPLLDLSKFPKCCGVIDVIFNPEYTALLLSARQLGIPHTGGLPMLVAQAKKAAEIFFDTAIDDARIEEIYTVLHQKTENIVLTGMPGSGKSTVGKILAGILGKDFIDTDAEIEKSSGMTIPEIFRQYGEEEFRRRESVVAAEAGKKTGVVIATGGGIILHAENYISLKQNGSIVFLKREIGRLATDGRPLSKDAEALQKMYRDRLPLYRRFCDYETDNNRTPEETAKQILTLLKFEQ